MSKLEADRLREARALIERGWCRKTHARNAGRRACSPKSDKATMWCMEGACMAVELPGRIYEPLLQTATNAQFFSEWNDAPGRTQAEVLQAFDRAIALAEQVSP